jgi:RNA polymerase sigma-70 factor (ECF subfamily)
VFGDDWLMNYDQLADAELMAQVAQRRRDALEVLYDRHAAAALGFAMQFLDDRALSEEAVQEAFWRVWKRAGTFDPGRAQFATWLLTIVHHLAIDELRRQRGRPQRAEPGRAEDGEDALSEIPADEPGVPEQAWAKLQGEHVRAAMAQLPEAQHTVVRMAYFEGLTHREIAAQLGEPLGTVHTRARLALIRLKELLADVVGA